MSDNLFVEIESCQRNMHGEEICGDSFRTLKVPEEDRIIAVLSDGLGHGVKASILSLMTATMALKFIASNSDIIRSAEIIMDALPVCQVRRISYSTFTIADIRNDGSTRIIEMGNPPFILVRNGSVVPVEYEEISSPRFEERVMHVYNLTMRCEDRIVLMSDGITQAGMGSERLRLGWRSEGCREFIVNQVKQNPAISARLLAQKVLGAALSKEPQFLAYDDMTAVVAYFRRPRRTLVLTGPPFASDRDAEFANRLAAFNGRTVISGGTTANIVARELDRKVKASLTMSDDGIPPASEMEGVDLVTEGILTLTKTARLLEGCDAPSSKSAASRLYEILLDSDSIEFLVGVRINEAHQDPTLPVDLEIRRNIIKRICHILEKKYLKEVKVEFL